jgi:small multidrug resistance family-3 protein
MDILRSILFFASAGLCEIGGGYLIWMWIKYDKPIGYGITGMLFLVLYGFVPTLQTVNFGRVYAAYGGVFILLSLLWGWKIDKVIPDKFDILGSLICLAGIVIIMLPRK